MKNSIIKFLATKGITVIDYRYDDRIKLWKEWYNGNVSKFHTYYLTDGTKKKKRERLTLNMPNKVCQDWADLLLNEKVELNCDDEDTQKVLDKLLNQVNFYVRGNNLIERAFALGGGFFIQYWDGEKTNQKYITQEHTVPITYDSGKLTECAFASKKVIKGKEYVYIEVHQKNEQGNYIITNYLAQKSKSDALSEVDAKLYDEFEIERETDTGSDVPLFQQVRPNTANKMIFDCPYGASVFANAVDVFKSLDLVYDCYFNEFKLGRKRIFVKDGVSTFNIDEQGNTYPVFNPEDDVFYKLPDIYESDPIKESNMELRTDDFDKALQTQLNLVSQLCGFGENGYKWSNGNISTATQIISENSKMFRTLRKHEILLKEALISMAKGLLFIESVYGNNDKVKLDTAITVNFDDSIIEDTAEVKRQAITDVSMQIISKTEYFRQVYSLNDEQAAAYQQKMADEISRELSAPLEPDVE